MRIVRKGIRVNLGTYARIGNDSATVVCTCRGIASDRGGNGSGQRAALVRRVVGGTYVVTVATGAQSYAVAHVRARTG